MVPEAAIEGVRGLPKIIIWYSEISNRDIKLFILLKRSNVTARSFNTQLITNGYKAHHRINIL